MNGRNPLERVAPRTVRSVEASIYTELMLEEVWVKEEEEVEVEEVEEEEVGANDIVA